MPADASGRCAQVEPSPAATRAVVERLGAVQHTMFGGVWEFSADGRHADTAYGRDELLPHTDGTYYSEPPGYAPRQPASGERT